MIRRLVAVASLLSLIAGLVTFVLGLRSDLSRDESRLEWRGRVYAIGLLNGGIGFDNDPEFARYQREYLEAKSRLNAIRLGVTLNRINPHLHIPDPDPWEVRRLLRHLEELDSRGPPPLIEHRVHYLVVVGVTAILPVMGFWQWYRRRLAAKRGGAKA